MFIECESKWGVLSVVLYFIEDERKWKKDFFKSIIDIKDIENCFFGKIRGKIILSMKIYLICCWD